MSPEALFNGAAYGQACRALVEHNIPPAISAVFLGAWQAGYAGHSSSTCPFRENGGYRHDWIKAHALGKEARI